jgi:hypothetical protein
LFRQAALPDGLADARKRAKDDPDMRWLVARYEQEHRALTGSGGSVDQPVLTRQAADAFAELACFMASEAHGQKMKPDRKFKEGVARILIQQWGTLNLEGRKQLAQMPLTLAQLRAAWPEVPAAQKEQARAQWRQQLGGGQVAQASKSTLTGKAGSRTRNISHFSGLNGLSEALPRESKEFRREGTLMLSGELSERRSMTFPR